ncbi:MAG: tRNA-(ms[2]io[6]A)-hydroxylase [Pseudomonadales bacterium]
MNLAEALGEIDELLLCPTPECWLRQAPEHLSELLIDHANCEKKAASTALSLTYRHGLSESALLALSKLAREELRHFEQVLELLPQVGVRYGPLSPAPYAAQLRKLVSEREPSRIVDTLLVSGIVEARSCERFNKLAPTLSEPLKAFYERLLLSEARHYRIYLEQAEVQAQRSGLDSQYCRQRLQDMLTHEAQLIAAPAQEFRFHSGALA